MNDIEKFLSDVKRIKKHDRADNGGLYDPIRVCKSISELLQKKYSSDFADLPYSIVEYWQNTYILSSGDLQNEPSDEHLEKLASMVSFLEGNIHDTESLSESDWKEIADCVKWQAEDIEIDKLSSLMTILVEKKALD